MSLKIKRIYEEASDEDGIRILVDRLWPRGVSRDDARLDDWNRELAPSDELRKWFGHDSERWGEFRKRYLEELKSKREIARSIAGKASNETVTLLYAAKDEAHNNAVVLRQYLEMFD